ITDQPTAHLSLVAALRYDHRCAKAAQKAALDSPALASPNSKHPIALTLAGSDPGGGAGIQADLKTFAALGVYGYSVITDVIAQNSFNVARTDPVAPALVTQQIESLIAECLPRATKTGALANAAIVRAVA